ncbi:small integral membrane protein 45 isoform X1 [Macaca mulatta]
MPHFLDWFVPVYLVISVLILVGFGACIYYFEPGLQEAHKWRMQRPLVDRDLRKTLMLPRLHSVAPALQLQAAGVKGNPRKEPKNLVWRDVSLGQPSRTPQGSGLELVRVCGGGVQKGKTEVEGWGGEREKVWGEGESLGR